MRTRLLKPSFFMNEDLADLGSHTQLLFAGLWCLADRDGKLEDRPKRIKATIFPYYDPKPSVAEMLNKLIATGFLIRYQVDGNSYIAIVNFKKHQKPHFHEQKSVIPDPPSGFPAHADPAPHDLENDASSDSSEPEDDATSPQDHKTPIFECEYFSIDEKYFAKLQKDYPAMPPELILKEISKASDWVSDNILKFKRKSTGELGNPKLFLRKWLEKVDVRAVKTSKPQQPGETSVKPLRVGKDDCALCQGSGTAAKEITGADGKTRYSPYACPCSLGKEYPRKEIKPIKKPDPFCPECKGRGIIVGKGLCSCLREVERVAATAT